MKRLIGGLVGVGLFAGWVVAQISGGPISGGLSSLPPFTGPGVLCNTTSGSAAPTVCTITGTAGSAVFSISPTITTPTISGLLTGTGWSVDASGNAIANSLNVTTGAAALFGSENVLLSGVYAPTKGSAATFQTFTGTATTGTYANTTLTGGSGTGAIATVTVTAGSVSNVAIATLGDSTGNNYVVGDVLSFTITGGSGTATVKSLTAARGMYDFHNYAPVGATSIFDFQTNATLSGVAYQMLNYDAFFASGLILGSTFDTTGGRTVPPIQFFEGCNAFTDNRADKLTNPPPTYICFLADGFADGDQATTGTITNHAFFFNNNSTVGGAALGTKVATSNGSIMNNYVGDFTLPTNGTNTAGTVTNIGLFIHGPGGVAGGGGTVTNWAINSTSTANSQILGPLATGILTSQPTVASTVDAGNVGYLLTQTALPFIINACSVTVGTGALTACVSMPLTYANAYMWFPASILAAAGNGSAAGFYAVHMSSQTAGQVCSPITAYVSGTPAPVTTCNTFSPNTSGAITIPTATSITMVVKSIAGNILGLNGGVEAEAYTSQGNTANVKQWYVRYGSAAANNVMAPSTQTISQVSWNVRNRGVTGTQLAHATYNAATTAATTVFAASQTTIDSTTAQNFNIGLTTPAAWTAASDFAVLESYSAFVRPN